MPRSFPIRLSRAAKTAPFGAQSGGGALALPRFFGLPAPARVKSVWDSAAENGAETVRGAGMSAIFAKNGVFEIG